MKKLGILRFLGTNCDRDVWQAAEFSGLKPEWLWFEDRFNPKDYHAFVVPGGFSYGDYLRCGALAAKAPVMADLRAANELGKPILGICNGFQILCESGLLPGALVRNRSLRFVEDWVNLSLRSPNPFWSMDRLKSARLPVAHGEGRYVLEEDQLKEVQDSEQIWWTYDQDINGSLSQIAGVMNKEKNVAALMPHPERAIADWMGGRDGNEFFLSLI